MPRISKFQDDLLFPRPNYWGKIMIYNNPEWDILYPIIDIIRILPPETIIATKHGKNQSNIRLYGSQYNHLVIGAEFNKKEFINDLKCVKYIFIFSDTQDIFADNLIKYCEKSRTNLICYSTLDSVYHFYEFHETEKIVHEIKDPQKVVTLMEEILAKGTVDKYNNLFPEFEIIEPPENKKVSNLEKCLTILREQQQRPKKLTTKLPFDANFNKIKYLEKSKEKVVYDDEIKPRSLNSFFKKKG